MDDKDQKAEEVYRRGGGLPVAAPSGSSHAREFGQMAREIAQEASWPMNPGSPPTSERLTLRNVDDAFQYHPWDGQQYDAGAQVRDALVNAAKVMLRVVPEGPLRTRALNDLIDSRMKANAAITFRGRF